MLTAVRGMIRVGIFFGGASREREVSFAGGRTVYDNLDKSLFEAVPIFVDAFGNFIELQWEYIYRGTIRDFFPPAKYIGDSPYQIYSESLDLEEHEYARMVAGIGVKISPAHLKSKIDFAFLALHGDKGEDGSIQGLLEWFNIPYSGSGVLPSAIGISKKAQKTLLKDSTFQSPNFISFNKEDWESAPQEVLAVIQASVPFPLVVKSSNQGSSIGVKIIKEKDIDALSEAIDHCLFKKTITKDEWTAIEQKEDYIRELGDLRSGLGFPLSVNGIEIQHPANFEKTVNELFANSSELTLEAYNGETEIVVEEMIIGREFSCIVIKQENGDTIALPPTEIVKGGELFDYRSKYLPGLSRKITPIDLEEKHIERIRKECQHLFNYLGFHVYARIDGFITAENEIYLNDPNTTSGMMPSSFFFHQAAEIGLNPSQFLTYIIRTSLMERMDSLPTMKPAKVLLNQLDKDLKLASESQDQRAKVGVIMGGYSTERHISVESGRNIYEKLSSSGKYEPVPIFLIGNDEEHELYRIPINIMLKDNADDIKAKILNFKRSPLVMRIIEEAEAITGKYCANSPEFVPRKLSYEELAAEFGQVFIALHGRPGEDGAIQEKLERYGIGYNGSGVASSKQTINKYLTNEKLRNAGFLVADHMMVEEDEWNANREAVIQKVQELGYPIIAKPVDEGCSSAVLKIRNDEELIAYSTLTFRGLSERDASSEQTLKVNSKDEFPSKNYFLVEQFVENKGAKHFLEITGGMLTHQEEDGSIRYEVFEPSEALSEGEVLSLAEKFLAGEGQNITPARFDSNPEENQRISAEVRKVLLGVAKTMDVVGYCRIDAFVRIHHSGEVEVVIIEINSLPGMTPATCIYHQAALNGYKPFDFIDKILTFGNAQIHA